MIFERIKSEGLSHNSYFIGSAREAAVIDPRRDCQVYLDLAREHGLKIKYILETHRNEDYVIGSTELNNLTCASIYHGPRADWKYGDTLNDGEQLRVGNLLLTAIHTPGHTVESMSYTLADLSSDSAIVMVFTGDAIFVGDVGRVDLSGTEAMPRMATDLYDSIFNRLLPLGDGVILCPAHGAGSVCGVNIADRDESTLGIEKNQNPVLQIGNKDDFIKYKLKERPETPPYFVRMEKVNLEGPPLLGHLPVPSCLSPFEFQQAMTKEAIVVDTREPASFGGAQIKGAYSIWLSGLPLFGGWVLPYERPLLLVLDNVNHLEKAVRYLIRIGYEKIAGYLMDGIEGWYNSGFPIDKLNLLSVQQLKGKIDRGEPLLLLDVRTNDEYVPGHIKGAVNIYVGHLESRLDEIPKNRAIAVYCSVGNRGSLASSILLRASYTDVCNVLGGMKAWVAAGFPVKRE